MQKEDIKKILFKETGCQKIMIDEPMDKHTSFKTGGPADIFISPDTTEQISKTLKLCKKHSIPIYVLGNCTNLIVTDKGIRGVVVQILGKFKNYKVYDNIIEAEAGLMMAQVSQIALENSLTGMEFASGIPGTFGGAVVMNAGAYDGEIKDVVFKTEYIEQSGEIKIVEGEAHQFGYRSSFFQKSNTVVLRSWMRLKEGKKEEIQKKMNVLNDRRREKQPIDKLSAGSIFKRPKGYYTGKLIQDCGLAGYSIGGASVSSKHCGFLINKGNATSKDIIELIKYIQDKVYKKFGVELKTEVKIIGE